MKQPLEDLTRKDRPWSWNRTHDQAMDQIKEVMLSLLLLEHYDPSKTLIVAADACAIGIGGVLLQRDSHGHERAAYHMAHSLTDAQRNYSQLKKEALALVTAVEKFHKFVWGRKFILQTDHKPLVALLKTENTKGLKSTTAARLKRWALRLLGYDFAIEYIRTQDFGPADALSRLIDKFRRDNADELQVARIQATEAEILYAIREGWKAKGNAEPLEHFRQRAEELSIIDDTLLFGDRVVIPEKLKPTILAALHKGHPGIRRTKQLAREFVYWPKMSEDIERLVRQCDSCALNQKLPVKVPMDPWPTPSHPMERVHLDYAGPVDGHYLLIFVDAYFKYGPPEVLVMDHGTQFTSELFPTFCKEMQISHLLSAVNHPQSNSQVERMVDSVKRAISKDLTNWRRQLLDFLYSYRYTPCSASPESKSPAELFFGRPMNSPFTKWLPKSDNLEHVATDLLARKRQDIETQFSKHHGAKPRQLSVGVVVLTRKNKRQQGVIHKVLSKTRYSVCLDDGGVIDRHINHIWKGGFAPPTSITSLDDDWMFLPTQASQTPRQESPPVPENICQPATLPAVQSPATLIQEPPIVQTTPVSPVCTRVAPKRLILDPAAKSYSQR
ncbi:hypothetical protein DMN91_008547 [Ooceraea biroi]|uniref:RNA-directed DNA polymerase n=1 Tax=Ooceraea biroi TaxID=2015173 RepID=A0A3L8DJG0_OOCBI|nr:uncharacterized protein K02A2.6-like [Ooceraea biroi]RLU19988.1 hypothetical protein DMN91_008547 [Ooceraea biroi]